MTAGSDQRQIKVNMVEKIREPYQKHSRNISAVSDISVTTTAEPLKRDENAEIRVILLCDSEVERNCVFEAIKMCLVDRESGIEECQILQHHWEQPHVECSGLDCRFCFRMAPPSSTANSSSSNTTSAQISLASTANNIGGSGHNSLSPHVSLGGGYDASISAAGHPSGIGGSNPLEGFFRFRLNGTIFRLMLLSKDRQNLLKIYSYDFIMVGVQVTNNHGKLDESIWEFEWKRLERHSKKAVAPIILFGYFRDGLKLGHGESLKRMIDDSKVHVKKSGRLHNAIPRFCDFVTGNSSQLDFIFSDVEKLYRHPGYILQQCAHINNLVHFTKIIENPNVTEEDVQFKDDSKCGDNPIMIAAKLRHKDLVSSVLRSTRFQTNEGNDFLSDLIHTRNNNGQTLLAMVALQGTYYIGTWERNWPGFKYPVPAIVCKDEINMISLMSSNNHID